MQIIFDLQLVYKLVDALNLDNESFIQKIIHIFKDDENFKTLKYYGRGTKLRRADLITTADFVKRMIKNPVYLSDNINTSAYDNQYKFLIDFSLPIDRRIQVCINKTDITKVQSSVSLLLKYLGIFLQLIENKAELDLVSECFLPDFEYPRVRPPRFTRKYILPSLVDIVNPEKIDFDDAKKITHNLCFSPLPDSVIRYKLGKYYCIDWVSKAKLNSEADLQQILTNRERWFYAHGDFELHGCNELGDSSDGLYAAMPTDYLTFYSGFNGSGLKATVLNANGGYDKKLFRNLKDWLNKKQTPDGKQINSIGIILPTRENCLKIKPVADQLGFTSVLYPSNDGKTLWNPFPDGLWTE